MESKLNSGEWQQHTHIWLRWSLQWGIKIVPSLKCNRRISIQGSRQVVTKCEIIKRNQNKWGEIPVHIDNAEESGGKENLKIFQNLLYLLSIIHLKQWPHYTQSGLIYVLIYFFPHLLVVSKSPCASFYTLQSYRWRWSSIMM